MSIDLRHHGDAELAPGLVDFAVNVRPGTPPEWLRERLRACVDDLAAYPTDAPARAAVAARHGRPIEETLVTAGAAEAFVLLARALRPSRAVVVHPSFTEPEVALLAAGVNVERVLLPPPFTLDAAQIPLDADLVVLGNPTNPTGVLHTRASLLALRRPGRVLVVDEAFMDFVPGEPESLAADLDVVVIRSLTKMWGLAGLRVGYLLGPADVVAKLAAARPPWPTSTLANAAAIACLEPSARAEAQQAAIEVARAAQEFGRALARIPGVTVWPTRANFLLVLAAGRPEVHAKLRAAGFAVRRCQTFPGLGPDYLRVAIRDAAANDALVTALRTTIG